MMRLLFVVLLTIMAVRADEVEDPTPEFDEGDGSVLAIGRCLLHVRKLDCAERRASTALRKLREEEKAVESLRSNTTSDLEEQLAAAAADVFSPEGKSTGAEGRGKHKKKIHKIIALIKIVLLIVVIKLKLVFLMFVGQTLFQFKIAIFTFIIMAIKKWKLYKEWKHSKLEAHKPVVYYENAHHQHHYDESDHFHDGLGGLIGAGHYGKEVEAAPSGPSAHGGGWGGFWGKRSYASPHDVAYAAYAPVHQGAVAAPVLASVSEKPHFV